MSSARFERFFASTRRRLSALYVALVLTTFVAAGLGAWLVTRAAATADVRSRIESEMSALQQIYTIGGGEALRVEVERRDAEPTTFLYRLSDTRARTLAGRDFPDAEPGEWRFYGGDGQEPHATDMLIGAIDLAGGERLTIAEDMERPEKIRDAILAALVWIGVAAVSLALIGGYFASRGPFSKLNALTNVVRHVAAGDMSARAPTLRSRDDIDELMVSFNGMLDRIGVLMGSIQRVSVNVAHDLRTPLTRVHRNLEAAAASGDQNEIAAAQHEISELLRTFDAVLQLAEIESGALQKRFATISLSDLAATAADAYRPDIEAQGLTLNVTIDPNVRVRGEGRTLTQAIANLLDNAMRHARDGDEILLAVDQPTRALVVSDNGPGIAEAARKRVLEPFERLEESRTTPGSGLGLSIVAAVAAQHEATLTLSDASPGLRVSLAFPAPPES